jgi:hypothetical protein
VKICGPNQLGEYGRDQVEAADEEKGDVDCGSIDGKT